MAYSSQFLVAILIVAISSRGLSFHLSPSSGFNRRLSCRSSKHSSPPLAFDDGFHTQRLIVVLRPRGTTSTQLASQGMDKRDEDEIVESETVSPNLVKLEKNTRAKIISESIAPWRTFRLFVCGTLGSGAAVGGLITLAGLIAGITGSRTDVDVNTEAVNLAIDFGAAALFGFIAKVDLDKGSKLEEKVGSNLKKKAERKEIYKAMKRREQELANLNLAIRVSADGTTTQASVKAIQEGAKQNLVIVVGPRTAVREALVGASLLKMNNFAMTNVLVIPYEFGDTTSTALRPSGGFGEKAIWEDRPYVAEAIGDGWQDYVAGEMADAEKQYGSDVKEKGIAIIVSYNGQVVRRGVGRIPWRQTLEQLNEMKATKDTEEYVSLL
jgi:hypothetical protein